MRSISDSMLQEPVDFVVTVNRRTVWHKLGLRRSKRKFVIYPLCLGTLLLVAKELSGFKEFSQPDKGISFDDVVNGIVGNTKLLARVVALAVYNKKYSNNKLIRKIQQNDVSLLADYIEGNLDSSEILVLCNAVIKQMEIEHFLACMGSMKGMEIVKDQEIEPRREISGE